MGWSDYTTEDRTALTSKYNIYQALAKALNERMLYVNPWGVPFTMAHGSLIPDAKRLVDRYRKNIIVNSQSWDAPFSYYFDDMLDRLIGWWGYGGAVNDNIYNHVSDFYTAFGEVRIDSRQINDIRFMAMSSGDSVFYSQRVYPVSDKKWVEQQIRVINFLTPYGQINSFTTSGQLAEGSGTSYSDALSHILIRESNRDSFYHSYYTDNNYCQLTSTNLNVISIGNCPQGLWGTTQNITIYLQNTSNNGLPGNAGIINLGTFDVDIDDTGTFAFPSGVEIPGESLDNFPSAGVSIVGKLLINYNTAFEFISGS